MFLQEKMPEKARWYELRYSDLTENNLYKKLLIIAKLQNTVVVLK